MEITEKQRVILDSLQSKDEKIREMVGLLIESRDALPAIKMVVAKLQGIDLTLANRIDKCLEPWITSDDDPDGI